MKKEYQVMEWTKERTAAFWEQHIQSGVVYFSKQVGQTLINLLEPHFKGKKSVLDYGCGEGSLIEIFLSNGKEAGGVDFSQSSIDVVNKKFKSTSGFLGAFTVDELFHQKKTFDVVTVLEVIEHLYDHDLEQMIKNIKQMLSPGGLIVLTTPNDERLEDSYLFCPNCKMNFHHMQHVRSWSESSLREFMEKSGFETIKTIVTSLQPQRSWFSSFKFLIRSFLGKNKKAVNLVYVGRLKS